MSSWLSYKGQYHSLETVKPDLYPKDPFWIDFAFTVQDWMRGKKNFQFFTSGSTGTPKPIIHRRENIVKSIQLTADALDLKTGQTSLVCLETRYIAGFMMVARSLFLDMNIILESPAANPLKNVNDPFDFVALVPYQYNRIIEEGYNRQLDRCEVVLLGGGVLNDLIEREVADRNHSKVFHSYGMTETISHIALRRLNGDQKEKFYQTLPDISIYQDERGCLTIESPFSEHPIMTNDIVEINTPTKFRWVGRADFVINSGGLKISPEELEKHIEPVMNNYFSGKKYLISSISDLELGEKVILIIESKPEPTQNFSNTMVKVLDRFQRPKEIFFLENFSFTPTGKVNRVKTRDLLLNQKNDQ